MSLGLAKDMSIDFADQVNKVGSFPVVDKQTLVLEEQFAVENLGAGANTILGKLEVRQDDKDSL